MKPAFIYPVPRASWNSGVGVVKCTDDRVPKVNFSQNTITEFASTLEKTHPY